jgi:hypothetical protein
MPVFFWRTAWPSWRLPELESKTDRQSADVCTYMLEYQTHHQIRSQNI